MSAQPETTYSRENPPPPPTAAEVAERYERERREAEERQRLADEEEEQNRSATKARLEALAERLKAKGASEEFEQLADSGEAWTDLAEHQRATRINAWLRSVEAANKKTLAAWTLDDIEDHRARAMLAQFVKQAAPGCLYLNLVISGSVGAGKTSAAMAAGTAAAEKGLTVQFVTHARYLAMLQPGGQPDGMSRDQVRTRYRRNSQLLVLDDFGAEWDVPGEDKDPKPVSEWARKETHELVSDRVGAGLPTIFTTNLSSDAVKEMFGPRTHSRIGQSAVGVKLAGRDRRQPLDW